jgi:hypothetical protein
MHLFLRLAFVGSLVAAIPADAQNREPSAYTDCDALYEREIKRYATQTNRDLRETQSKASLHRMRCERAVERKMIQGRGKKKTR